MNFRYRDRAIVKRESRSEKFVRKFSELRRPVLIGFGGLVSLALLFAIGSILLRERGQAAAEAAFARAEDHYAAKEYRAARVELMNAVKASPNWTPGLIAQANVALELFDGQTAKTALEHAVVAGAKQVDLQHLLGQALWMTGDSERAEILLSDEAIPDAKRGYALRVLGRLYSERGDYDLARDTFEQALKYAPDDSRLWTEIARFRFVYADHEGAIAASDKAVALDGQDVRAIEFRGQWCVRNMA
ncbi:MAG: tetratricopeptide repeat protein [Sphingomonadales bacterium]|nr:tetratricopeptide repeat protein [Sphingomonadales bacterium]